MNNEIRGIPDQECLAGQVHPRRVLAFLREYVGASIRQELQLIELINRAALNIHDIHSLQKVQLPLC